VALNLVSDSLLRKDGILRLIFGPRRLVTLSCSRVPSHGVVELVPPVFRLVFLFFGILAVQLFAVEVARVDISRSFVEGFLSRILSSATPIL